MGEQTTTHPRSEEEPSRLKRALGPRLLFLFVLGDMLGGGIYALVGEVGAEVGGAIWSAFLAAFVLALLTAFAYVELVTKYPRAAGAALYVHKAFGRPFLAFMVTFAVMCSGVASAGALALAFAGDLRDRARDAGGPGVHRDRGADQRRRHLRVGEDQRHVHHHRGAGPAAHRRHRRRCARRW
jgi:hypothetical protein